MDNIYIASGVSALVTSVLLQVAKNSDLVPWINRNTGKINAAISMIIALGTSLGIAFSFDIQPDGAFAGHFSGNLYDIGHIVGHTIAQWAAQHGFYKGLLVPAEILGEIRSQLAGGTLVPAKPLDPPSSGGQP